MRQRLLLVMLTLAGVAIAQVSGPSMGLIFDPSQSALRPILGMPGAATLGGPVNPGFAISSAVVAPRQDYALAVRANDSSVVLVRTGAEVTSAAIAGARPAPALMVFSPAGTAAALYDSASGLAQILTGLPDLPAIQADMDVSVLAGPVAAVAVDDAGGTVLVAAGPTDAVSLYRIVRDSAPEFLASFRSVAALRIDGRDALLADPAAGAVYRVRDVRRAAAVEVIASGLGAPIGVESDSAGRIFVADQGGTLTILDRSQGAVAKLSCGCSPAGLFRLSGTATFRLTEPSGAPIWVLDASAGEPQAVAIPPAADEGGKQ